MYGLGHGIAAARRGWDQQKLANEASDERADRKRRRGIIEQREDELYERQVSRYGIQDQLDELNVANSQLSYDSNSLEHDFNLSQDANRRALADLKAADDKDAYEHAPQLRDANLRGTQLGNQLTSTQLKTAKREDQFQKDFDPVRREVAAAQSTSQMLEYLDTESRLNLQKQTNELKLEAAKLEKKVAQSAADLDDLLKNDANQEAVTEGYMKKMLAYGQLSLLDGPKAAQLMSDDPKLGITGAVNFVHDKDKNTSRLVDEQGNTILNDKDEPQEWPMDEFTASIEDGSKEELDRKKTLAEIEKINAQAKAAKEKNDREAALQATKVTEQQSKAAKADLELRIKQKEQEIAQANEGNEAAATQAKFQKEMGGLAFELSLSDPIGAGTMITEHDIFPVDGVHALVHVVDKVSGEEISRLVDKQGNTLKNKDGVLQEFPTDQLRESYGFNRRDNTANALDAKEQELKIEEAQAKQDQRKAFSEMNKLIKEGEYENDLARLQQDRLGIYIRRMGYDSKGVAKEMAQDPNMRTPNAADLVPYEHPETGASRIKIVDAEGNTVTNTNNVLQDFAENTFREAGGMQRTPRSRYSAASPNAGVLDHDTGVITPPEGGVQRTPQQLETTISRASSELRTHFEDSFGSVKSSLRPAYGEAVSLLSELIRIDANQEIPYPQQVDTVLRTLGGMPDQARRNERWLSDKVTSQNYQTALDERAKQWKAMGIEYTAPARPAAPKPKPAETKVETKPPRNARELNQEELGLLTQDRIDLMKPMVPIQMKRGNNAGKWLMKRADGVVIMFEKKANGR